MKTVTLLSLLIPIFCYSMPIVNQCSPYVLRYGKSQMYNDLLSIPVDTNEIRKVITNEFSSTYARDGLSYTYEEALKYLRTKYSEQFFQYLWPAEIAAIKLYTKNSFQGMNQALRNARGNFGSLSRHFQRLNSLMVNAIHKLPTFQGTVYRVMQPERYLDDYRRGLIIEEYGFISASSNKEFWETTSHTSFGDELVLMEIKSKRGKDLDQKLTSQKSKDEDEIIFGPGTYFKIIDRYRTTGFRFDRERVNIDYIIMEEI